ATVCLTGHLVSVAMCSSSFLQLSWKKLPHSAGSMPGSALRAEPPQNEFAFPKNSLAEQARARPGHAVPRHVLHIAAAVADEVVMPHPFGVESCGAALHGHFPHQTGLNQVP